METIEEQAKLKLATQLTWVEETRKHTLEHYPHLKAMMGIFEGEDWKHLSPWFSLESYEVFVMLHKVEDINEVLKKVHGLLRKAGYVPRELFDKEELQWHWKPESYEEELSPSIRIKLVLADGGKCKRVCIGTKEVPVYEIQCDDGAIEAPVDEGDDKEEKENC